MRLVIQRVTEAKVEIDNKLISKIGKGLLILVGVEKGDREEDADWLASKAVNMRIFPDETGVMNKSLKEVDGNVLAVSQFTLLASCKKGNRPSYIKSARHELAIPLYESFCKKIEELTAKECKKGVFGADMKVSLVNDGPVTIVIDSRNREY